MPNCSFSRGSLLWMSLIEHIKKFWHNSERENIHGSPRNDFRSAILLYVSFSRHRTPYQYPTLTEQGKISLLHFLVLLILFLVIFIPRKLIVWACIAAHACTRGIHYGQHHIL